MSVNFNRNTFQCHFVPEAPLQARADQQSDEDAAIIPSVSEQQVNQWDGATWDGAPLSPRSVAVIQNDSLVTMRCAACRKIKTAEIWHKVMRSNPPVYRCAPCSNTKNYGDIQRTPLGTKTSLIMTRKCDACEQIQTGIWHSIRYSKPRLYRCPSCYNTRNYGNIQRPPGNT